MPRLANNFVTDFSALQDAVADLIADDSELGGVETLVEEQKDLASQVDIKLKQIGLCIVVNTINPEVSRPNMPGPVFDKLTVSIDVHERPLLNRKHSGRTALSTAAEVAAALHGQPLAGTGAVLLCKGIYDVPESPVLTKSVDFTIGK
jgi:hypothetical protein